METSRALAQHMLVLKKKQSEIPSACVTSIPQTSILESATSGEVIVLPATPVRKAMDQNSNNSLDTSPPPLALDNSDNNRIFTPKEGVYCDVCDRNYSNKYSLIPIR